MFTESFVFLFLLHLLGDFYLQTQSLAARKQKDFSAVLLHCGIYGICCLLVPLTYGIQAFDIFMAMVISHAAIDITKFFLLKDHSKDTSRPFIIDQLLHIAIIAVCAGFLSMQLPKSYVSNAAILLEKEDINPSILLKGCTMVFFLAKPCNILLKYLLSDYRPAGNEIAKLGIQHTGASIGTVERLLIFLLIYMNQYAAIGLVLTAKSIARFDRITKDQVFAEYYLLGTLLSACIAIFSYLLIFR
jgi:hypothetical protein